MAVGSTHDIDSRITSLVHLYRGEVARGDAWRARLDRTTNWALTTAAGVVSFVLSSPSTSHVAILAGIYLVLNFLLIEAGRYQKWDVYLRRVRLLEVGVFVPLLRGDPPDSAALRELGQILEVPRIEVRFWVARAQRIRRAYGAVLGVLLGAWLVKLVKLTYHGEGANTVGNFVEQAHVGFIPGELVLCTVGAIYLALTVVTILSFWTHQPSTELRPHRRRRSLHEAFERAGMRP